MLPSWLNAEFIQTKLRAYCKDDQLRVLKLWGKPATGKGENFIGIMTRICVDYEDGSGTLQNKSYILKQTCPAEAPQARIFFEYDVYTREMDMYEFVLPKMAELLREIGITEKLTADCVAVDRQHSILILEDLAPLKYVNADRLKQLDMAHAKLVLELQAKLHAAAVILNERHPELLAKNFSSHFFCREKNGYAEIFTSLFKSFMRYVKTKPSLNNRYGAKLEVVLSHLMEYAARTVDVDAKDFQTLIHGDCWTNNIMFQYDDRGTPINVVLIDFQFCTWTSPAGDLHYFCSSSLREDAREKETELVQYHYYAMKKTLAKFSHKCVLPSLLEYQLQFERRRFMSFIIANTLQPLMLYEGTEEPDFYYLYQDTPKAMRFRDSMYASEKVQRIVEKILPMADAKGLLDPQ
ncbi:uncharacterized protein LOC111081075 [Drosophila obscura]|uniref:uncharacterized protein LOC111081075 n=1 Tax=Drosophila obscura TaxID=7282 RepID=UPI001BB296B0|nr:uncharacterized protein LOC111081075 [Drosophila obscura]